MAMRPDPQRAGAKRARELGLSIIEALVIVTVTAMLALLLLPLASRAAERNFTLAERSLDAADAAIAEGQFRALLRGAGQTRSEGSRFTGHADSVTFFPALAARTACAGEGDSSWVRLRVVGRAGGGVLQCESEGRRVELLAWSGGEARFLYSSDAAAWAGAWTEGPAPLGDTSALARSAPLVKLEITINNGPRLTWVERAGWTEPLESLTP